MKKDPAPRPGQVYRDNRNGNVATVYEVTAKVIRVVVTHADPRRRWRAGRGVFRSLSWPKGVPDHYAIQYNPPDRNNMSIDTEINRFLDFWEDHGRAPEELRVSNWVLRTPGCEGDFGCCSKQFDIAGLTDALYELAGREEPSHTENEQERHAPPAIRIRPASNGDPGCVDIIVEQGGFIIEHHKNKALDENHPSVPQSERDAIEKERQDANQDDHEN
jgi:hypothetical protein